MTTKEELKEITLNHPELCDSLIALLQMLREQLPPRPSDQG